MAATTQQRILFRQGSINDLASAEIIPGSLLVTTDKPGLYIDVDETTRKRIGDFIFVNDFDELLAEGHTMADGLTQGKTEAASKESVPTWNSTALYYVQEDNALLKYNPPSGTAPNGTWTRINVDIDNLQSSLASIRTDITKQGKDLNDALSDLEKKLLGTATPNFEPTGGGTLTYDNIHNDFASVKEAILENQAYIDNTASSVKEKLIGKVEDLPNSDVTSLSSLYQAMLGNQEDLKEEEKLKNFRDIYDFVEDQMTKADAMKYKGVIGIEPSENNILPTVQIKDENGNNKIVTVLPNDSEKINAGDTYKVGYLGVFKNNEYTPYDASIGEIPEDDQEYVVFAGDLLIADEDGQLYFSHISSGYEDEVEMYISASKDNNAIYLKNPIGLINGGITLKSEKDAFNKYTSNIRISSEAQGAVNGGGQHLVTTFGMYWDTF